MTALEPGVALYDARRRIAYLKPSWRGWLHLVSFEIALVVGTLLIVTAQGALETTTASLYAATVAGMFGASAAYHRGRWGPVAMARMQRLDHTMIVLLIAGTATPPMALALAGPWRAAGLSLLWSISIAVVVLRMTWIGAPERLVGSLYVGLGWLSGASVPAVWVHFGLAPAVLLLAGGLLYSLGALGYHRRRPDPVPSVFGYHEVFHLMVCLAAACQYVAIACFVL